MFISIFVYINFCFGVTFKNKINISFYCIIYFLFLSFFISLRFLFLFYFIFTFLTFLQNGLHKTIYFSYIIFISYIFACFGLSLFASFYALETNLLFIFLIKSHISFPRLAFNRNLSGELSEKLIKVNW